MFLSLGDALRPVSTVEEFQLMLLTVVRNRAKDPFGIALPDIQQIFLRNLQSISMKRNLTVEHWTPELPIIVALKFLQRYLVTQQIHHQHPTVMSNCCNN